MSNGRTYIKGITIHQHKTFLQWLFGEQNVLKGRRINGNWDFEIIVSLPVTEKTTKLMDSYMESFKGVIIVNIKTNEESDS